LWLAIAPHQGVILVVDVRHPVVTNGDFLHSCAKVREAIKLLFGVVSGVSPVIGVLDGVHIP